MLINGGEYDWGDAVLTINGVSRPLTAVTWRDQGRLEIPEAGFSITWSAPITLSEEMPRHMRAVCSEISRVAGMNRKQRRKWAAKQRRNRRR